MNPRHKKEIPVSSISNVRTFLPWAASLYRPSIFQLHLHRPSSLLATDTFLVRIIINSYRVAHAVICNVQILVSLPPLSTPLRLTRVTSCYPYPLQRPLYPLACRHALLGESSRGGQWRLKRHPDWVNELCSRAAMPPPALSTSPKTHSPRQLQVPFPSPRSLWPSHLPAPRSPAIPSYGMQSAAPARVLVSRVQVRFLSSKNLHHARHPWRLATVADIPG